MWNTVIINPIFNLLVALCRVTGGNLGLAIIFFTLIAKTLLIPTTIPAIKMTKKQNDIQPELQKIKEKFKYDKKKQAELQMELFKKHGINPASGCLTTIITFAMMIAIYRVISMFTPMGNNDPNYHLTLNNRVYIESFKFKADDPLNTQFLNTNLSEAVSYVNKDKKDVFQIGALVITIFAVFSQFLATKMMMPYSKVSSKAVKQTPGQADDIMQSMQKQNLYVMPVMFLIFGLKLPAGVMLYIFISTLFQIGQTYYFSGWGGLKSWIVKLKFGKKDM